MDDPADAAAIRDYFRDDRSRMTMMAARHFGVPERRVVEALRTATGGDAWPIRRLRDDGLGELVEALPDLGPIRVFVRSRAAVLEVVGTFGGISRTGPFLNVQTETIDMHLIPDEVGSLYAVEKVGHDTSFVTHSFQAFDRAGEAAFKAFLWDDFPNVPAHRVAAFHALSERLAAGV